VYISDSQKIRLKKCRGEAGNATTPIDLGFLHIYFSIVSVVSLVSAEQWSEAESASVLTVLLCLVV
jgi:hypothetical protein